MLDVEIDVDYRGLIRKAYLEPIKSVLAIDDQYQSLDNVLNEIKNDSVLNSNSELPRQIETLSMVRSHNWLADMHDGQTDDDDAIFERLHQCDLLLLDYHLDVTDQNAPEKALNILSKLNENPHFNLVIVYTAADNLRKVKSEIFIKLSSSFNELFNESVEEATKLFEQWESDGDSYHEEMLSKISRVDLEKVLLNPSILEIEVEFSAIFNPIDNILNLVADDFTYAVKRQIYLKLMQLKVEELKNNGDFSGSSSVKNSSIDSNSIWLKTEKLFITVISKLDANPNELPEALITALEDWRPTTNRLLLSKIRSELDDNGQSFENEVLKCEYTNAGWLTQFCEESNGVDITVHRLMEGLTNMLCSSSEITLFSNLIKQRLNYVGLINEISKECPSISNLKDKATALNLCKALNAYIGTKGIEGEHLMTGHVIEWIDPKSEERKYFLCLTPACDLVPGRVNPDSFKGQKSDLAPFLPVKMIQLIKQNVSNNERKALQDITKKPVVILKIDEDIMCFKAAEDGKSVFHEQVFANHQGEFSNQSGNRTVEINRTILNEASLTTEKQVCRIVAHLRYEYALSLLQRLGQDLSKIGLDYVALK